MWIGIMLLPIIKCIPLKNIYYYLILKVYYKKNPSVISNNKESDYGTASEPKEEDGTINVEEVGENIGYSSSNRF